MSQPAAKPKIRSARQNEMLMLIEQGLNNEQIAATLNLSPFTIRSSIQRIFKVLGVHNRTTAVKVWRADVKPNDVTIAQLRQSRAENEANILALQELVKLQTTAIELMLKR